MKKLTFNVGTARDDSGIEFPSYNRRLSLEEKILRIVRRYRARERYRLKRRVGKRKRLARHSLRQPQHRHFGGQPANVLEKAVRVCNADTLDRSASAAAARIAPGFVAGRLLAQSGCSSAGRLGPRPTGSNVSARQ